MKRGRHSIVCTDMEYVVEIKDKDGDILHVESCSSVGEAIKIADDNQRQDESVIIWLGYRDCEGNLTEMEVVFCWS